MLKYVLILSSLLFATPAGADAGHPDLMGIKLGETVKSAEKACRKQKGEWLASHLNLFSCKATGFNASVEADGKDVVNNVYVTFKQVKIYNEEMNSFILKYNDIRSTRNGANDTVLNEFTNDVWSTIFTSYGENGNYTAHLYNIKDMLSK